MFNSIIKNGQKTPLYYHKTDGGAEYFTRLSGRQLAKLRV